MQISAPPYCCCFCVWAAQRWVGGGRRELAGHSFRRVSLGVQTLHPQHLVTFTYQTNNLLRAIMDINSKEEFIYFMQRACEDQSNDCYIELYNILLR